MTQINKNMTQDEFNAAVTAWGEKVAAASKGKLQASVKVWPSGGHKPLARSVGAKRYDDKDTGEAKGIGFKFAKHGIYVHYGVGRGYVYSNGTVVRAQRIRKGDALWHQHLAKGFTRKEIAKKYVAGSGEIRRKPVDWLDSVLKSSIGELADIVGEYHGDKAMKQVLEVLDRATIGGRS